MFRIYLYLQRMMLKTETYLVDILSINALHNHKTAEVERHRKSTQKNNKPTKKKAYCSILFYILVHDKAFYHLYPLQANYCMGRYNFDMLLYL